MLGNELAFALLFLVVVVQSGPERQASISSVGKSRRSSMWSKKLPQSISSMKFAGPIMVLFSDCNFFIFLENFGDK